MRFVGILELLEYYSGLISLEPGGGNYLFDLYRDVPLESFPPSVLNRLIYIIT